MRKYILLLILSCFHVLSRGQTPVEIDLSGVPEPTHAESIRYWFDDDAGTLSTSTLLNGIYTLDASSLLDGLHTIHYQIVDDKGMVTIPSTAIFMKMDNSVADKQGTAAQLSYWFDDQSPVTMTSTVNGIMTLDASSLLDGLHTIHYQITDANGVKGYIASSIFMKMNNMMENNGEPVTAKKLMYWFDDETEQRNMDITTGIQMLDASHLLDGLHTLHYQVICSDGTITSAFSAIFMRMNVEIDNAAVAAKSLRYWFDGSNDVNTAETLSGTYMLDASTLLDGLHTIHYQVVDVNGGVGGVSSSIFMKMDVTSTETATSARKQRYWFDDDMSTLAETDIAQGAQMLDASQLLMGLHTVHYQLVDEKGEVSSPYSALFMKMDNSEMVDGKNAITGYMCWLNDKSIDNKKVKLDKPTSPCNLVSLIPVPEVPVRSSNFQFEITDGKPMMYAKNDIHVRFYDARGYWSDDSRSFIDYKVGKEVTDIEDLLATQTFTRPAVNDVKWFKFEAEEGDSIDFKSNVATSIQVFSPSGKEIYAALGDKSVVYGGAHTWEDGTFYVAVHDVTGSRNSLTFDYVHIDKYAVLRQNVTICGNGGLNSIVFEGNGFKDLYAIEFINSDSDTIRSEYIGHEKDSKTSAIFDFANAKEGQYDAFFHFTEGDVRIPNCITVEEEKPIELATEVTFPSAFPHGKTTTYTIEIKNSGNMTAFKVPIYTWIMNKWRKDAIYHIEYEGLDLPGLLDCVDMDSLSVEDRETLSAYADSIGDAHYFLLMRAESEDTPGDSVWVRSGYFFTDVAPYETKTLKLHLSANEGVWAYITVPDEYDTACLSENVSSITSNVRKRAKRSGGGYCCVRERVECVANITTNALDIASLLLPGNVAVTVSSCVMGSLNMMLSAAGDVFCGQDDFKSDFIEKVNNVAKGISATSAVMSCLSKFSKFSDLSSIVVALDHILHPKVAIDCITAFSQPIPNCPPKPPGGGGSGGGGSWDPNDIIGYVHKSGSKYVNPDVVRLPYQIEFENDTTFATASAHMVIVKDTLDDAMFDLASYQPTSITIGDKNVQLKGDKEFVTTIDMRPEIYTIAQVEGKYDEQKGIATWKFTSLDPMTMEETDDVMQGFLPVNYDGNGIGEVAYSINLKPGLVDGTEIKNHASIVFDANDPILTPTWTNIIDAVAPTSHVSGTEMLASDSVRIHFEGADERSGVWKYTLYAQYGEGTSWEKVAETDTTCVDFKFYEGMDYGFCVLATDSAGNVEQKELMREYGLKSYLPGDANSDGKVDMKDAILIINYYVGVENAYLNANAADANGDGIVDMKDAIWVIDYYVHDADQAKALKTTYKRIKSKVL